MVTITLTTDYGTRDHFAGVVKGVMLSIAPKATLVDISHDVPPFDVLHAAFLLRQFVTSFPPRTVHLVVVDPGVGTNRRLVAGQYEGRFIVAPDNGVLTLVHRDVPCEAVHWIENPRFASPNVSTTFHGRDVLAPAAAHLASGVRLRDLGRPADTLSLLPVAHRAEPVGGMLRGSVIHVDRFGNLITNIRVEQLSAPRIQQRPWEVRVNGIAIGPIRRTFADVSQGEPLAYLGSSDALEVGVNCGSAAERFGPRDGIVVEAI